MVKRGFSIIELVVVIGLISLLAIAMSAILLTTIVASNRVRTMTKIKQAGDYTITQLQTMVRNARAVSPCDSTANTISIAGQDGGTTDIQVESDRIASGSGVYITPEDLVVNNWDVLCLPSDDIPTTVQISFNLENAVASTRSTENPSLHFETTVQIRNE